MSAAICPKQTCGGVLDISTNGSGRIITVCPRCVRKAARLCRLCPRRTRSRRCDYCDPCGKQRRLDKARVADRERYPTRRDALLAAHKRRAALPDIRERRRQYMRNYRKARPRDDIDRLVMREYMRRRRADPAFRAKELARKRSNRQRHTERQAA